jgi:hypothetical protein
VRGQSGNWLFYLDPPLHAHAEVEMETHIYETTIRKRGYLELKNLPFDEGAVIRIAISTNARKGNLERLINNDHVWIDDDIRAVQRGRDIINQWEIS